MGTSARWSPVCRRRHRLPWTPKNAAERSKEPKFIKSVMPWHGAAVGGAAWPWPTLVCLGWQQKQWLHGHFPKFCWVFWWFIIVDFSNHPFPPVNSKPSPKKDIRWSLFWSTTFMFSSFCRIPKNSPFLPPFSRPKKRGSSFPCLQS